MENANLTVVIPVYNQPGLLEYTLWQLQHQDIINPKVIVVDDSSDLLQAEEQKVVSQIYNATYIYEPCYPKRMRKHSCIIRGLGEVKTEFVGTFDVHGYYDKDYLYKCYSVLSKYKNVVVTHHWYWLKENIIQFLLGNKTIRHLDGSIHVDGCDCIDWKYFCRYDDIRPTEWGTYADGNFFLRTNIAKLCHDPAIYGYANSSSDVAMSAIYYGQSNVVLGDVHGYHISHYKQNYSFYTENENIRGYVENKYKIWGPLPKDNGLVLA